jgi:transketolase
VEHLAALRAIPGLTVIRPADAAETAEAWRVLLEGPAGPACLVLTRQGVPVLERGGELAPASALAQGAYVLAACPAGLQEQAVLVGTGSEVAVALEARRRLAAEGVGARVVSMPSWELFSAQDPGLRQEVIPAGLARVSVEAAATFGWERWVDRAVGVDRFGASAPGEVVLRQLGITPEAVVTAVSDLLD